jgi:hypothetical protein
MPEGYVYILLNRAFQNDHYKIGMTRASPLVRRTSTNCDRKTKGESCPRNRSMQTHCRGYANSFPAARGVMFAGSTEARTQELLRPRLLFADRTQEGDRHTLLADTAEHRYYLHQTLKSAVVMAHL